jgi:integrase
MAKDQNFAGVPTDVPRASRHGRRGPLDTKGRAHEKGPARTRSDRDPAMTKTTQRPFGTVRELASGRFQARWMGPDGHVHNGPTTFPTRDAAKDWLASERSARAERRWIDRRISGQPFAEVAAGWRLRREAGGYRVATWTRDVEYLDRYVLPRWGAVPLEAIDPEAIEGWYLELAAGGGEDGGPLSAATVHKVGQIFANVLDSAVRFRKLLANPARGVRLPRDPNPREMQTITPAQIEDLAEAIGPRWRLLVLTGCFTGLRIGELFALRAGAVDLERRRLHVRELVVEVGGRRYVGPPKTAAGRRVVPFPRTLRAELADAVAAADHPGDLVFPNTVGDHQGLATFRSRYWRPATEAADLAGLRIHDMRHTAVSLWIAAGTDPKTIATWAGHRSVATVLDRYGHLFDHDDDDPTRGLDALLRRRRRRPAGTVTPIRGR